MATRIHFSPRYGSHLVPLLLAVMRTTGDVLELGLGVSSTPVLHALCQLQGRRLVTIENNREWFSIGERYASDFHQVLYVPEWADAPIERPWSVALVDHSPDERRAIELERLAPHTEILIAHDANRRYWKQYGYDRVFPTFAHRVIYDRDDPATAILSSFINVNDYGDWCDLGSES